MHRFLAPILLPVLLLVAGCGVKTATQSQPGATQQKVLAAGKIRASYAIYEPLCMRGADGKLTGVGVEILEEVGKRLNVEIEWTEEVGWGAIFEGLQAGRHDVFGTGVWQNGSRGRVGLFSRPLFFNPIKAWGRPGETRYKRIEDMNAAGVKISTQDGAMEDLIAQADFGKATQVSIPQLSPWSDVLMNITTSKADVTFAAPDAVHAFLENNPGTLAELFPDQPLRVFPTCFAFGPGSFGLRDMVDSALAEILNDGTVDRILRKYSKTEGSFYRVARPYQLPR